MILVTGATGFIGSYTVRALRARGDEVVALSRYDYRPEALAVIGADAPPVARVDWDEPDALAALFDRIRPDTVVHLDAHVNPVALRTDPMTAIRLNVDPTLHLLELCRTRGVARFVYASSVAVLPSVRYEPIDADHPLVTARGGPAGGFYGVSKAASEVIALGYADAFDLDVRIVRPSAVYGFGMQWPIGVKPVVEGIVEGREVEIVSRGPLRDFTPVEDVADIIAAIAHAPAEADRVVNAGTGRPLLSPPAFADAVRAAFPDARVRLVDGDLDPTGIEGRYRGVLDMAPVREQLGVQPTFASLEEGLQAYARRYGEYLAR